MKKSDETGWDRLRKVRLWQWGVITISAGVIANIVMGLQPPPASDAAARGAALGRGVGTLIFVISGLVLVIVGLARRK